MERITTKFGREIYVGQPVILNKTFGNTSGSMQTITEISKNGRFFKVTNSSQQFSTITGNAKGMSYSWYVVFI